MPNRAAAIVFLVAGLILLALSPWILEHPERKFRIRGIGLGISCTAIGVIGLVTYERQRRRKRLDQNDDE